MKLYSNIRQNISKIFRLSPSQSIIRATSHSAMESETTETSSTSPGSSSATPISSADVAPLQSTTAPRADKSWCELRQMVRESRKQLTSLVHRSPSTFQFHTFQYENVTIQRLYFLGIPCQSRENTLMYVDIPADPHPAPLPWQRLLDSSGMRTTEVLSKEEQLLRERKRLDSFGITAYEYHEASEKFVFPACNTLFVCEDSDIMMMKVAHGTYYFNKRNSGVVPMKVTTDCPNVRLDPKFCPSNSDWLAFVHNNDIWVTDTAGGGERRLTFAHKGDSEEKKTAGIPSYIVQEEFHRYTGYWWEPDTAAKESNIERILYEEVNETDVMTVNIYTAGTETLDEFKFPRAGTNNAVCTLKIVEIDRDSYGRVGTEIRERQLCQSLTDYFPWCEYIVRAGWTPDGKVWAMIFDRRQGRMALVLIPLECFVSITGAATDTVAEDNTTLPRIHVIYEETSYIWVKVHDLLHFFPQLTPNEVTFIWASEKSGHRHLYLVTSSLEHPECLAKLNTLDDEENKAIILKEQALTTGTWEVSSHQLWVDSAKGLVYFMALKDTVLESHLYVTSYLCPRKPQRLTTPGYSHNVHIDTACSRFVTVYSSIDQAPMCTIYSLTQSDDGHIIPHQLAILLPPSAEQNVTHCPHLFSYTSKAGHTNHGMVYKPHDFKAGIKYPTVMFVYGGPEVQLISNSFKALKNLRLHTLAATGYVVVSIDGRGSTCRGLQYEGWVKNRLGTVEIEEQVEGLHWLASNVDYIDLDRVAIHGWSYGGYLSLLGLAQRPDVFKLAISGAPVTQWTLYDTGYTERYMDLPNSNPEGYKLGSVLSYVEKFPDEPNRLLIIHGLMDENVHIQHTTSLVDALVRHCKPYQLQLYPGERHGIRNVEANDHYKTTVLSFLQKYL